MSGALRGKGKVVPRQASVTALADKESLVQSFDVTPRNRARPAKTQETRPAAALPEVSSSSSREGSDPSDTPPGDSIVTAASPTHQHQWRCAAYLPQGSPVEVLAHDLGKLCSRQALSQHQPVLVRRSYLASCRLQESILCAQADAGNTTQLQAAAKPMSMPETAAAAAGDGAKPSQQNQSQYTQKQQQLLVMCSPANTNRFIAADLSKNLPGSYYHIRKPETTQLQMTFEEWYGSWSSWKQSRLLLQALLCKWQLKSDSSGARIWPNTSVWPHLHKLLEMAPTVSYHMTSGPAQAATAGGTSSSPIDWVQLRQLLSDGQYNTTGQLHLLAGGSDALLPAKYETCDRLICQVAGRQQLLLLPPHLAFDGLYPYPVAHPYDGYSCVDWEEPELAHWPAAGQVRGLMCELSPGDTLLVPAYWFVHSQLQQPACVALVLHLQPLPSKLLSRDALLLQLSRMIECWVGAVTGTANIRQLLMALSAGQEWQQLAKQISTVKGYKQIKVCHMVMRHLQQLLALAPHKPPTQRRHQITVPPTSTAAERVNDIGATEHTINTATQPNSSVLEAEARNFLCRMCEERLMPTYWLNEGIMDPLYLKYQPQLHVIKEDAQAAKYPTLFRHKLIAHRPDWMQHAEQLQIGPGRLRVRRLTSTT